MTINKALIFDLGNVVFHCSMDKALASWAICSGQELTIIKQKLDLNHPTHDQFERGEIEEDEFRKFISDKIDFPLSKEEFQEGWNSIYGEEVSGISALIDAYSVEFRIIGLTNSNKTHAEVWESKYSSILSKFESIFSSHEIHCRKPEQAAYQVCIDYLDLAPSNIIFLDDKIENIQGAVELGLAGILVESFDQMNKDLNQLLLN